MTASDPRVISTRDELRLLVRARRHARFRLDLPDLSSDENLALERQLRRAVDACGCAEAAAGLVLGLIFAIIIWFTAPEAHLGVIIALPLVIMVIGKAFGQWRARRELRRVTRHAAP